MSEKTRTFPLPLSSVTDKSPAKKPVYNTVATPQTATQNAARTAAANAGGWRPQPVASPSRAHSYAQERAQVQLGSMPAPRQNALVSDGVRRAMVQRVAKQGVSDPVVLGALDTVPRHMFMDEGLAPQAYIDASLPIGHHQTISQPYIVARMIEVMRAGQDVHRVLEIGTGCGYQAAVLACVAKEVYSIERIKSLHELAKANLRPMRVPNLRLHYGDGMLGLPQAAPFDGIILAAAGLEVPQALLDQLNIGGRLVAPVGARTQHLELVTRVSKNEWVRQTLEDCHFVPLRPGTV
ncbi:MULTISPECIES: protein-L-isoaspartate(D-aspartate) O-methyltransferase [unclassified Duganella]|uniref:protein-L-isoaspartate(D-aspartate) O-methyltransferase n=1 Tax=unclassified Duganella TaxID=2636909 RepID=UPI0006FF276A|nr:MULTISPECIES: protein-L-isoaspartate(D-aspartate) O-methyltransferase [unclassified Duganella]KQV54528.1 protein-L-isoaspartate O-methyltransferase [Duganella sp. Root336D2]KRC03653.1 protein-L-isoaspartate O-methyltransferase [Duganella sp. Root198D2]